MYRAMLSTFINISSQDQSKTESTVSPKNLLEQAIKDLNEGNKKTPDEFRKRFNAKVADITSSISPFYQQFKGFIQTMACRDETWRFWIQYVFVDAMAYVSLFFAIRSGDWHLRMSSVKSTAAVFTAFDHPTSPIGQKLFNKSNSRCFQKHKRSQMNSSQCFRQRIVTRSQNGM